MRIGIDLMGSDCSPSILFKAVQEAVKEFDEVKFVVFLTQPALDAILLDPQFSELSFRICVEFHIVSEVIEMDEEPVSALKQKKSSSLVIGLRFLKKNYLNAFISTGNTGSLIAGAALMLPLIDGIKRPALVALLPTQKGNVAVIDVGGTVSCRFLHLAQFAHMGAAYQACYSGIAIPKVGLLNIGVESKKGTSEIRKAYQFLEETDHQKQFEFIGNIEARKVFEGGVDVLITDGFTGNVLLKTAEGMSYFVLQKLLKLLAFLPDSQKNEIISSLKSEFDYENYLGAVICGVERLLIKCHGHSTSKGLLNAIRGAIRLVENQFVEKMKNKMTLGGEESSQNL